MTLNTDNKKISKDEWKKRLEESKILKIIKTNKSKVEEDNKDLKENFYEALFACDEMFVKDLQSLIEMAKEFSCHKGESSWELKILAVLGNDTILSKNNYEIKGYSHTSSDGRKRFFSNDVFVYGLHPKKDPRWTMRHFQPWLEKDKVPGFWRVKMELENDEVFPCWLIDNSNPEKSKWSYFKIFFDEIPTKNITIKKNTQNLNVKTYGNQIYWHGGNTIGTSFRDLVSL